MHPVERALQVKNLLTYNFIFWCLMALLSGLQRYSYAFSFGYAFQWESLIRHPLATHLTYWTLSYALVDAFLMSRRWRARRFILLHLPLSLGFGLAHKLMSYVSGLLLERLFLPMETLNWRELILLWQVSWFDLIIPVVVYWMLLLFLLGMDYWQRVREQATQTVSLRHQLSEVQLQSMRMQLQPHFLFNALNTITMMVRRRDDKRAVQMITGLSEMLRNSLSRKKEQFISLEEELKLIGHYLELEQGRFQDRLRLEMEIQEASLSVQVPNLILQPIVENAFKHGIAHCIKPARLRIAAYIQQDQLMLEVYNSTEVAPHEWILAKSKGIGLRNTIERLRQLYQGKARMQFNAMEDGVLVRMSLPIGEKALRSPGMLVDDRESFSGSKA